MRDEPYTPFATPAPRPARRTTQWFAAEALARADLAARHRLLTAFGWQPVLFQR